MLLQTLCVSALEPRKHSKLDFKRAKPTFVRIQEDVIDEDVLRLSEINVANRE